MPNPYDTYPGNVKGAWLTGYSGNTVDYDTQTYIQATNIVADKPYSGVAFEIPYRRSKVVQLGKEHGHEGTISGRLMEDDIYNRNAADWAERLRNLIKNQDTYDRVELVSKPFWLRRIFLLEGYNIDAVINPTLLYVVQIPFVQIWDDDLEDE